MVFFIVFSTRGQVLPGQIKDDVCQEIRFFSCQEEKLHHNKSFVQECVWGKLLPVSEDLLRAFNFQQISLSLRKPAERNPPEYQTCKSHTFMCGCIWKWTCYLPTHTNKAYNALRFVCHLGEKVVKQSFYFCPDGAHAEFLQLRPPLWLADNQTLLSSGKGYRQSV